MTVLNFVTDNKETSHIFDDIKKKFTQREIDILSFIISGRSSKKIAIILSISSRTVDNHMRNIMIKLGCNSREQIIEYVENSGFFPLLKTHFFNLNLDDTLKKSLRQVKAMKFSFNGTLFCFQKNKDHICVAHSLQHYLTMAGLNVCLSHECHFQEKESLGQKIFILDENIDINSLIQRHKDFFQSGIFVHNSSYEKYSFPGESFFFDMKNFGSSFFRFLTFFFKDKRLEKVMDDFEKFSSIKELDTKDYPQHDINIPFSSGQTKGRLMATGLVSLGIVLFFLLKDNFLISGHDYTNLYTHSNITSLMNHSFLERHHMILRLRKILKKSCLRIVALIGIGGSGKTTLARQYAHKGNYSFVWEINAESSESLLKSCEDLGESIMLTDEEIKKWRGLTHIKNEKIKTKKITLLISNKLKSMTNWLLIFDNVEKITDIQKYFPDDINEWKNGHIIITTTDTNIKNSTMIHDVIFLEKLNQEEKWQLFNQIVYHQPSNNLVHSKQKKLKHFLDMIPSFPLDVSTAAYYLKITNISFEKYSEYLENFQKDLSKVQTNILKDASDYTKTRYGIVTLSFKKIFEANEAFGELLLLMGLLNSQKIPKDLLDAYQGGVVADSFIYHLKKYSLITDDTQDQSLPTFSIHRHTQKIGLEYIVNELKITPDDQRMVVMLNFLKDYVMKAIKQEDFSAMRSSINHLETFLKHTHLYNKTLSSSITGMLGCIYYYMGSYIKAKNLLEESLFTLENMSSGQSSIISIVSMYLGNTYRALEDYGKAKDMLGYSLKICQKNTDNVHNLARALGYLGVVYRNLGEYYKAKDFLEQSLALHEKHFPRHIGHAWILSHLASTHMISGDYPKAKLLFEKSLSIYLKSSEDYVGAGWVMGYLGNTYRALKEYTKANELLDKSLVICKKHFDDQHAYIGSALRYLGMLYMDLGLLQKAKKFLDKSIDIYTKNYGENHIEVAKALHDRGKVSILENQLSNAEDFVSRSLTIYKKHYHIESYAPLETLADICEKKANQTSSANEKSHWKKRKNAFLKESFYLIRTHFPKDSPHLIRLQHKIKDEA